LHGRQLPNAACVGTLWWRRWSSKASGQVLAACWRTWWRRREIDRKWTGSVATANSFL